jgi:excisionase family DNA binding protein
MEVENMGSASKPVIQADFVGLRELAQKVGVNYRTIHRAAQSGKIQSVRFGSLVKIPRREAERILQRGF